VLGPTDPIAIARSRRIVWIRAHRVNSPAVIDWLKARRPDLFCITTFPQLLGEELLSVPKIGTINLHPSLLPRYRGPSPLFWMARNGEREGGVTIHWVDAGEDTGDIILQEAFPIRDGMTSEELERQVIEVGSWLMGRAVEMIARAGRSVLSRAQGEGHRDPRPRPEDAEINPAWGARRIHNFIRLARKWSRPYLARDGARHHFDEARWLPKQRSRERDVYIEGNRAVVSCSDGTVILSRRGASGRIWGVARMRLGASVVGHTPRFEEIETLEAGS
jgi:methionyl-tRNA formyltransferase